MAKRFAAALFAGLLAPVCALGQGNTPTRARVTIKNDGGNVVIERSQTTAPAPRPSKAPERTPGLLDVVADMKAGGASDAEVLRYLSAHSADLPSVIDSEDVQRLRRAGAGKGVVAYLARVSAVDIGETGEGHDVVYAEPAPAAEPDYSNGIPYYEAYVGGGYSAPYRGHSRPVFPRHPINRGKPTGFHNGRPPSQAGAHSRAEISRMPANWRMQQ